jgi:NADH:ubiquinone oxidoreductase subunit K
VDGAALLAVAALVFTFLNPDLTSFAGRTTTLALLFVLGATLTTWLSPRGWYAALIVTAAPFCIGIVGMLLERSGWTALSTGVAFALALALTLLITRRPGMTMLLRSAAARLLVPALAVVVVCPGAQLSLSGSPIVLPVVAVIVAVAIPLAPVIASRLAEFGISVDEADAARRWRGRRAVRTLGPRGRPSQPDR